MDFISKYKSITTTPPSERKNRQNHGSGSGRKRTTSLDDSALKRKARKSKIRRRIRHLLRLLTSYLPVLQKHFHSLSNQILDSLPWVKEYMTSGPSNLFDKYNKWANSNRKFRELSRKGSFRGLILLVIAVNAMMVFFLYNSAPLPISDQKSQPLMHTRHSNGGKVVGTPPALLTIIPTIENRRFRELSEVGLVHFSAYQTNHTEFRSVGLSKLSKRSTREMDGCRFEYPNGTTVEGKLTDTYPGEHHSKEYEATVLFCELESVPNSKSGGSLSLIVNKEEMSVLSVPAGSPTWAPGGPKYKHRLTYCGSPMYGSIDARRVFEWLKFHSLTHHIDHFHLYDAGGIDSATHSMLQPWLAAGVLDIADIRKTSQYETWLYSQVMVVNDCALRIRESSQWGVVLDIDEYLVVNEVPHSLLAFLEPVESMAWISFGSLSFAIDVCRNLDSKGDEDQWSVERMVFREPEIHCRDPSKYKSRELCLKWDGHRKYVFNPRKGVLLQIHRMLVPYMGGLDAHTSIIRLNHFRGLGVRNQSLCSLPVTYPDPAPRGLLRDFTVARMALMAKKKA